MNKSFTLWKCVFNVSIFKSIIWLLDNILSKLDMILVRDSCSVQTQGQKLKEFQTLVRV
jgi:hypothetical protein